VITLKAVISLLMVSRDIIPFDNNVVAVGTTSDNISSNTKTLDEASLSSSKSET